MTDVTTAVDPFDAHQQPLATWPPLVRTWAEEPVERPADYDPDDRPHQYVTTYPTTNPWATPTKDQP